MTIANGRLSFGRLTCTSITIEGPQVQSPKRIERFGLRQKICTATCTCVAEPGQTFMPCLPSVLYLTLRRGERHEAEVVTSSFLYIGDLNLRPYAPFPEKSTYAGRPHILRDLDPIQSLTLN